MVGVVDKPPGLIPNGSEWHFSSASCALGDRSAGISVLESFSVSSLTSGVAGRAVDWNRTRNMNKQWKCKQQLSSDEKLPHADEHVHVWGLSSLVARLACAWQLSDIVSPLESQLL